MCRLSNEHSAEILHSDKMAALNLHAAAHCHDVGSSLDWPALNRAVIDVRLLRADADDAAMVGIEDDEVGVGAGLNGAFAREEAKQLGDSGGGKFYKAMQVDAPGGDAVCIEQLNPVFDARNAIGNLRKVAAAHFFLLVEVERSMISSDSVDLAGLQRIPQGLLVRYFAKRRRHDIFRAFKVGPLGMRSVEHQIRNHGFDPETHAALARAAGSRQRGRARGVDDIDMRAG